ncbi:MAG: proline--tRNA ligase [Brevinematales bacterium]|nr:proline--tRNA ligase [Brevinematales bacterium]
MLLSKMLVPTLREVPKDAEITSHILMYRAGLIRKLGSGLYTFLPMGLRTLHKVINIIREEMNNSGALELLPPILIPAEYWKESGRYDLMGKEMFRLKDRHEADMVLGPTHEEVFTSVVRENVRSYRDLPLNLYQINTKFRDEIRPRFGVMRCREFIMKDAYSFDIDEAGLDKHYEIMRVTYRRIFKRCGLEVVPVLADTGNMGGSASEEFMVPSTVGEEEIIKCPKCDYVANVELAKSHYEFKEENIQPLPIEEVHTPNAKTIEELVKFFNTTPDHFIKSIVYVADGIPIMVVIRGDFEINETKLKNLIKANNLELADEETILKVTNAPVGFASPIGLKVKIIADESVVVMKNAISGANKKDYHLKNICYSRDFKADLIGDIRKVKSGESCPKCKATLESYRGIEVGHIFKLGYKYTNSMNVKVLGKDGKEFTPIMGCYGIGVGRTMASVIEQNNDEDGIIWPITIAPFHIIIVPINMQDEKLVKTAFEIYERLSERYEVLIDDRDERPGVKFKDADLIGIPIRITVGKTFHETESLELKVRRKKDKILVKLKELDKKIEEIYNEEKRLYEV